MSQEIVRSLGFIFEPLLPLPPTKLIVGKNVGLIILLGDNVNALRVLILVISRLMFLVCCPALKAGIVVVVVVVVVVAIGGMAPILLRLPAEASGDSTSAIESCCHCSIIDGADVAFIRFNLRLPTTRLLLLMFLSPSLD